MALVGECSRCGSCCVLVDAAGTEWSCEHLARGPRLGEPGSTACRIHAWRGAPGLSIVLRAPDGRERSAWCHAGTWREEVAIRHSGMARGHCSLRDPWEEAIRMDDRGCPPAGQITRIQEVGAYLQIDGLVQGRKASIQVAKATVDGMTRAQVEAFAARQLHLGVEESCPTS